MKGWMINMKDFFDLIARRESCRNYDPNKKVETEKLVKCIEAARLAPLLATASLELCCSEQPVCIPTGCKMCAGNGDESIYR